MPDMTLSDYLDPSAIELNLKAKKKDGVLDELVSLVCDTPEARGIAFELAKTRESLGSTGIGMGIAIPHLRATIFSSIRLAYGHSKSGIDFGALDGAKVNHFFLVASPPVDPSNLYHPILAKVVQLVKAEKSRVALAACDSKAALLNTIDELGT